MMISLNAKNKMKIINGEFPEPNLDSTVRAPWDRNNDMIISWILNTIAEHIEIDFFAFIRHVNPTKSKEDHGTSGGASACIAGKSLVALQGLLERSTLAVEFGVTEAATVSFVTSSVTPTSEHEGGRAEILRLGLSSIPSLLQRAEADASGPSQPVGTDHSVGSFYVFKDMDAKTLRHVYIPKWNVINDSMLNDPDNKLLELSANLVLAWSKDAEIASSRSQVAKLTRHLSSLQLSCDELSGKASSIEFEKDKLVSGLEVTCSGLREEVMGYKLFKERVEEILKEKMRVLSDCFAAIDSDLMEMVIHMDADFYPRYLTTIAGQRWILSRRLRLVLAKFLASPEYLSAMGKAIGRAIDKGMQDGLAVGIEHGRAGRSIMDIATFNPSKEGDYVTAINALRDVNFSLLAQLEANKDSSMVDIMKLLQLEGPAVEAFKASQLQPSPEQLRILIHRLEDHVVIGETPLAFSLKVAHNRVQRVRGEDIARRLSLTGSILLLVEPLSARNLTGRASSSMVLAIAVTTALSTMLAQTDPVPLVLSIRFLRPPRLNLKKKS
uniref:Cold-regulated 47 n=1 Tax=Tanacetum cinerariifolium TaxID=118510 RepID=A0A699GNT9_TANCI|nr:cold-regulated 47 [Tanacetum cinerariifolium]